jgi:hypothetical protein
LTSSVRASVRSVRSLMNAPDAEASLALALVEMGKLSVPVHSTRYMDGCREIWSFIATGRNAS